MGDWSPGNPGGRPIMEAINPCKTELYPGSITLTLTIKNCVFINE